MGAKELKCHFAVSRYWTACHLYIDYLPAERIATNWRDITCLTCASALGCLDDLKAIWQQELDAAAMPADEPQPRLL